MSARIVADPPVLVDRTPSNRWRPRSGPAGARNRRDPIPPRLGWHAYRPLVGAPIPDWAAELALTIERPLDRSLDGHSRPRAVLLARATGWWQPLGQAFGDAMRGVDRIAGTGPPLASLRLVPAHPQAGFEAVADSEVTAQLRLASERGHATGYRRARAHRARVVVWEPGAGAVLTCRGQVGASSQAVVAVSGHGDSLALRPPPGGATIVRAWRCPGRRGAAPRRRRPTPAGAERRDAEWALTTAVVVASAVGSGLGRTARRIAAQAETAGWRATVVTGTAALALARAGDPRYPAPTSGALRASRAAVLAMLTSCLAASASQLDCPALPPP